MARSWECGQIKQSKLLREENSYPEKQDVGAKTWKKRGGLISAQKEIGTQKVGGGLINALKTGNSREKVLGKK